MNVKYITTIFFVLLILILSSTVPVAAQSNETATNETVQNNTTNQDFTIGEVDHEFQFSNLQVDVTDKSLRQYNVTIYNPTNKTHSYQLPGTRGEGTTDIVQLRPDETENYTLSPNYYPPIYSSITISEPIPLSEYESGGNVDDASFRIEFELINITMRPPTPSVVWEVFVAGLVPIIITAAGYNYNLRWTRLAIPIDAPRDLSTIVDRPDYATDDDASFFSKFFVFGWEWIRTWSLIILMMIIQVWGMLRFAGQTYAGTYTIDLQLFKIPIWVPELLENSMTYMMYGQFIFFIMFLVGIILARQKFKVLYDVDPRPGGDIYHYRLTPNRFAEMEIRCEITLPSQNTSSRYPQRDKKQEFIVDDGWIFQNNRDAKKESYEVIRYDMNNNIAYVPWSGQLKKLNPSLFKETTKDIDYIMDTAIWAIDRYYTTLSDIVHIVQEEIGLKVAEKIAILEGAETEGMEDVRERIINRTSMPDSVTAVDNPLQAADEKHGKTGRDSLDSNPSDPRNQDVQTGSSEE